MEKTTTALLMSKSIMEILPAVVKNELVKLPIERQQEFSEEFGRKSKKTAVAYLFWLFFGLHYAYLGRWGMQILFWLTAGGFLIWWLIDAIRIPGVVADYNRDMANDVMRNIKMISSNG